MSDRENDSAQPSANAPLLSPEFTAKLETLALVSRKLAAGRLHGERRTRKRGESLEFADHRAYAQGDDLRRLDWNLYGRLEKLFLKLFLAEEDLSFYLLLDGSRSMAFGTPSKFDYARRAAAALAYVGLVNMDRVTVAVHAGGEEHVLTELRGRTQAWRLFRFLEDLRPDGQMDLREALRRFLLRRRRPGILVILSDFLSPDGFEEPLKSCLAHRMETCALHLLAREELEPQIVGDVKLVDVETGDAVDVTASARLFEAYEKSLRGWCASLRDFCAKRGMIYALSATDAPVEGLVLDWLRRAQLVK
jgi:hypothetical protein